MKAAYSLPVSDILPDDFKLTTLKDSDTISTTLNVLVEKNFYGAPVFNVEGSYIGMIELEDLVKFLVSIFNEKTDGEIGEYTLEKEELLALQNKFNSKIIKELVREVATFPLTTTVQDVINVFVKDGVSRVPLTDSDGNVVAIISQSQVLKYLATQLDHIPKAEMTLEEADISSRTIVVGYDSQNAISSFATMVGIGVSHLALVSSDGFLISNISVKDISGVQGDGFLNLVLPVMDYVNIIRRKSLKAVAPVIHASVKETVGRTISRLVVIKIHRIYLTNTTEVVGPTKAVRYIPTGVVSIRDILSLFATS